jgi:hypothetical protein
VTPEFVTCLKDSMWISGDTVINGHQYKIIEYFDNYSIKSKKIIREDTVQGKVWFYGGNYLPYSPEEYLVMDLSLNVGDIFFLSRTYPDASIFDVNYPLEVDSIYFVNGMKYLRLNYYFDATSNEKFTFMEGIGTNVGFDFGVSTNKFLMRQIKDDVINFQITNPYYSDLCTNNWAELEMIDKEYLNIFPNPASSILNIYGENINNLFYTIRDISGRSIVFKQRLINNQIDISCLNNGVYFIEFLSIKNNNNKNILKFVKQ